MNNYVIYQSRGNKEIKRIVNHNKVERNIVIEEIKRWNNSGDYDTFVEIVEDEKTIKILDFYFKITEDETLKERCYKLENAIEEITQIIARL
jgi:hypothetical protein